MMLGGIELEGDTEDDCGIAAEGELPIKVFRVRWNARRCHIFTTVTEFVSSSFAI